MPLIPGILTSRVIRSGGVLLNFFERLLGVPGQRHLVSRIPQFFLVQQADIVFIIHNQNFLQNDLLRSTGNLTAPDGKTRGESFPFFRPMDP